jgi:hypothetical protein
MRVEGEALLNGATGRWYGIIRVINDDGSLDTLFKTEQEYKTRAKAEEAVVKKLQGLLADEE